VYAELKTELKVKLRGQEVKLKTKLKVDLKAGLYLSFLKYNEYAVKLSLK
jgi:hypothetical protein